MWGEVRDRLQFWQRCRSRGQRVAAAEARFEAILATLRPDDVTIDCGANVGDITGRLATTGANVHAFEPDPDAFAALHERFAGDDRVHLHNAAVGTASGRMPLYPSKRRQAGTTRHSVSSSLFHESKRVAGEPIATVDVVDFPRFVEELPVAPRLVKMDIEGAEVALLEAMLASGVLPLLGQVFVETHEKQLPSLRARTLALVRRVAREHGDRITLDWV